MRSRVGTYRYTKIYIKIHVRIHRHEVDHDNEMSVSWNLYLYINLYLYTSKSLTCISWMITKDILIMESHTIVQQMQRINKYLIFLMITIGKIE